MNQVVENSFRKRYPHLLLPAVVLAKVTGASRLGDTYELTDIVIRNDDAGSSFDGGIVAHWYQYTLHILDHFGQADKNYPEIPFIRSKLQLDVGAIVAVGLSHGELSPAIIGEVQL